MLLERGDPADLKRASALNEQALAVSRTIGMTRLQRMADGLESRLATAKLPALAPGTSTATGLRLTRRETEVLHLLSMGKSNRQISEDLFLSARTVERHVENIYRKLDVHRRAEAIAFALRQASV